jgi:FkbM family methyltransferase
MVEALKTLVDVGCRGGPRQEWLEQGWLIIGFDPDIEECLRLQKDFPQCEFYAVAMSDKIGTHTLYLTQSPCCSSLYRPLDSVRVSQQRLKAEEEVATSTLDQWFDGFARHIGYLKIDVQGGELDVLRGAENILKSFPIVECEVEFNPLYEGQPLFGDVDRFLRERGYMLRSLGTISKVGDKPYWTDAVWVKT